MRTDADRQARFLDLVHAQQGAIRRIAALYATGTADRQDLFQEILLQLWRAFPGFRGECAFSTFLYRVALNTALMRLRGSYRRPAFDARRAPDECAAPEAARNDEDVERLYGAIRGLPPLDRAIVLLALEEHSHAEIAAVTGLGTGNVGVRLVRIRARLRKLLGSGDDAREGRSCSTRS